MKIQIQLFLAGLCGLLPMSQAFVAPRSLQHASSPSVQASRETTRLQGMLLILEQNDGDDDDDETKRNAEANGNNNAGIPMGAAVPPEQQQPSLRIVLEGDLNDAFRSAMGGGARPALPISEWKEQLKHSPPPPLTSAGKARLEKEIALLAKLADGDEAATQLSNLWQNARGPRAAKLLKVAESLLTMGHPIAWRQAEELLLKVVQEEGVHFVEPLNHLGTLMFVQGRVQEAKELCELVLSQKPWHMGALLGAFSACKKLDDYKALVQYDQERMPQWNEGPERRAQWVRRMVPKAEAYLQRAEEGLQNFFNDYGEDSNELLGSEGSILLENEHSEAWQ